MLSTPKKICLVGLSKKCTKLELASYLSSIYPSSTFTLILKANKHGHNFGWATVTTKDRHLYKAILETREFCLKGKAFFAKQFMNKNRLKKFRREFEMRKVFVNRIPLDVEDHQFRRFFSQFGELEDSFIVSNKEGRLAFNYGFLVFRRLEDAENLLRLGSVEFEGGYLDIEGFRSGKCKDTRMNPNVVCNGLQRDKQKLKNSGQNFFKENDRNKKIGNLNLGLKKNQNEDVQILLANLNFQAKNSKGKNHRKTRYKPLSSKMETKQYQGRPQEPGMDLQQGPNYIFRGDQRKAASNNSLNSGLKTGSPLPTNLFKLQPQVNRSDPRMTPQIDFSFMGEASSKKALKLSKKILRCHRGRNIRFNNSYGKDENGTSLCLRNFSSNYY